MAEHTPGPWSYDRRNIYASDYRLAEVHMGAGIDLATDSQILEANRALIAAAPELLAALKSLLHDIVQGADPMSYEHGRENVKMAQLAVAKARGQETGD